MLRTKRALLILLLAVMAVNLIETNLESMVNRRTSLGAEWGERVAVAAGRLEGGFRFASHDAASLFLASSYSFSYFVVLPLIFGAVGVALWRRRELAPFRVFSLSMAFDYAISLPFFLLFPLPERWAHPDSGAILLSDLLSPMLIEIIRPMSGLDNSFPSFHCSMSVAVAAVCYLYRLPYRHSVAALAATVVLSTFVLGIHWLPDIVAGCALGVLSVLLAARLDARLARAESANGAPLETGDATPAGATP